MLKAAVEFGGPEAGVPEPGELAPCSAAPDAAPVPLLPLVGMNGCAVERDWLPAVVGDVVGIPPLGAAPPVCVTGPDEVLRADGGWRLPESAKGWLAVGRWAKPGLTGPRWGEF